MGLTLKFAMRHISQSRGVFQLLKSKAAALCIQRELQGMVASSLEGLASMV